MIVCYLRSSSIGSLEMCEMKYFLSYVLGYKDKQNKAATLGTIFHRAMQVFADKKLAQTTGHKKVVNNDIGNLTFAECDNVQKVVTLCFDYYKTIWPEIDLKKSDLNTCIGWVEKALAFKGGMFDPRTQNVYATEKFFDIEIEKDWSRFHYDIDGNIIEGNLSIKGTVDLVIQEDKKYFQILDYKTGQRKNWATNKKKEHADLQKDPQLLLYYYALKNMHPDWSFYSTIYYINDGGDFDVVFDEKDYIIAENMLKQKFQYIKSVEIPKRISIDQSHFKCKHMCAFSQIGNDGISICQSHYEEILKGGISKVTANRADFSKIAKYGDGGGRLGE